MSDHVLVSRDGPVMTLTLNRPEKFNALTFEMYARIGEICRNVPTDGSVRVVVLTGAGTKAFAAGTDISLFRDFKTEADGVNYEKGGDACFSGIEACPVPTIAAIAGACTGGGAGIVACCDMRIATRDMKYGFPIARTLGNVLSAATLARTRGASRRGKSDRNDLHVASDRGRGSLTHRLRLGAVRRSCGTDAAHTGAGNAGRRQCAAHHRARRRSFCAACAGPPRRASMTTTSSA